MTRFALTLLIFSLLVVPARADYQSGIEAYDAERYEFALDAFRPLAERGDGNAEFMLGVMYFYGKGVVQDESLASIWFYKAARRGIPNGQLAFGAVHIRGRGVRRDLVKAHMWLSLALGSGVPGIRRQAQILRKETARLMTAEELEKANESAANFKPTGAGPVQEE